MTKYIISLVYGKIIPPEQPSLLLGNKVVATQPDVSIQNEVFVLAGNTAEEAYQRAKNMGQMKYPDHNLVVKVIIEAKETDLM